jgi:hypothetical protein
MVQSGLLCTSVLENILFPHQFFQSFHFVFCAPQTQPSASGFLTQTTAFHFASKVTPLLAATGLKNMKQKKASININFVCFSSILSIPPYRKKHTDPK